MKTSPPAGPRPDDTPDATDRLVSVDELRLENLRLQAHLAQALCDAERLRFIAEKCRDAIYQIRFDAPDFDYISPAIVALTGYNAEEISAIGFRSLIERIEGDYVSTSVDLERRAKVHAEGRYHANYLIRTKDGATRWLEDRSVAWHDSGGQIVGWVGSLRDISDRKRIEDELEVANRQLCEQFEALQQSAEEWRTQSTCDALTGLFNRRHLEESLEREVNHARRVERSLGVVMFDIDCFKSFNDSFGHEAGDRVLIHIAQWLSSQTRRSDISCRYGGEEFVVLLPDATLAEAARRAEGFRAAIASMPVELAGRMLGPVTLSLGVAAFPTHGQNGAAVLRAADAALYAAKKNGRNRVEMASGSTDPAPASASIVGP